ncbi:hypothetical protein LQ568_17130 [Bacillus amyloliquefaciens]|nr:hypothetical protein [Bacillus velezensis]MCM8510034.1 hypothetical protein [Bacillus amyloliquefaciens]WBY41898.1 hypothetical protein PF986_19965 [Bacillus velezensis]
MHDQLDAAVHLHRELSELLLGKGWLLDKQFQTDSLLSCRDCNKVIQKRRCLETPSLCFIAPLFLKPHLSFLL